MGLSKYSYLAQVFLLSRWLEKRAAQQSPTLDLCLFRGILGCDAGSLSANGTQTGFVGQGGRSARIEHKVILKSALVLHVLRYIAHFPWVFLTFSRYLRRIHTYWNKKLLLSPCYSEMNLFS